LPWPIGVWGELVNVHLSDVDGAGADNRIVAAAGRPKGNARVWACFGLILFIYVFSAFRVGPVGFLGRYEDDTIYFSAAKALASGQGYVLPSFPIPLRMTKYPELYPLVLAGIWKIDPHFPENVDLAVGLTLVFGCAALLFAFLLLRRWPGMGDWPALIAVALVAFTSHFVLLSADVLSDVPFTALMLGAIWLAEKEGRKKRGAAIAGLLVGLSVGLRSLGIAVGAGIGLAFLLKRKYGRLGWFCATAVPLGLFFFWPALAGLIHPAGARLAVGPGDSGWTQTLCYYSSYACSWRMNVTNFRTLASVVKVNLLYTSAQPGAFLTQPLLDKTGLWSVALIWLLSFAAWIGIARRWKTGAPEPYVLTFLFSLALLLPWPYPDDRFLLPFLPLLFGGFVMEARNFVPLAANSLRNRRAVPERALAGLLALAGLALAATIAVNYIVGIPVQNARLASQLAGTLADRRGAYNWIRRNAAPGAKVIAYEDGLVYLYTGRKAIRPINCQTQVYYLGDRSYAERDAARLFDVARHIGASYWLVAPGDYLMESPVDTTLLLAKEKELLASAPLVYESADGAVRLYDVRGLTGARPEMKDSNP
jgi:Dolichyl-phosphate-mannose-protein mannosyltransferase